MKSKKPYNNTSRALKAAGIPIRPPKFQPIGKVPKVLGKPKTGKAKKVLAIKTNDDLMLQMAQDKAAGMTDKQLAQKYSTSQTYVRDALAQLYVNNDRGREILKGILLTNAIAFNVRAAEKIEDLNGMQSVVAGGISTQRYIDLDKHVKDNPKPINLEELARVGAMLKDLRGSITIKDDEVIDISGD